MSDTIDLLQIKIEKARASLPEETLRAIDAVPWKITILEMRQRKGYTIEQLGELEMETELLLCGLLNPDNYPKELEVRMKIPRAQVDALVNEMNDLVFKKIREVFLKNTEKKPQPAVIVPRNFTMPQSKIKQDEIKIFSAAGIKIENGEDNIMKEVEKPNLELKELESGKEEPVRNTLSTANVGGHSILAQKLSDSFQIKTKETEHNLENISKTDKEISDVDPYREMPK